MEPSTQSNPGAHRPAGLPSSPLVVGRAFLLGMVLLLIVGYLAYCGVNYGLARFEDADAKRVKERQKILADRLAEDVKWLHGAPSWSSKDKGLARVPIEQAMRLAAAELAGIQPHPAEPIAANPPQPSASPASPVTPPAAGGTPAPAAQPPAPAAAAAPTPAAGAPAPLPGSVPTPVAAPGPTPAVNTPAVPAPLASPAAAPAPAPAGATPSPSPNEPGVKPGDQ